MQAHTATEDERPRLKTLERKKAGNKKYTSPGVDIFVVYMALFSSRHFCGSEEIK
jgi:hypothetical protein